MLTERFLTSNKCSIFNPFSARVKRGHSTCPRHNPYLVLLFNSPVCNIPENTNSVMSHNGIRIDSLDIAVSNIVGINIADHCISRILCQSFLEMSSERYFFILFQKKHLTSLVLLLFVYQVDLLETNLCKVLYFAFSTSLPYQ